MALKPGPPHADRYAGTLELYARASEVLPGGVSSNFRLGGQPAPLFFASGAGAELTDVDGNRYLDYALGMGPAILGHAPPSVVRAVAASLATGQLFAGQHVRELELATRIRYHVPCAERVRFGMSGSEMVQAALRVSRAATGRQQVVKFEGHYHGWLDNIYVNVAPPIESGRDPRPIHAQSLGQVVPGTDSLVVLPWNDADAVEGYLERAGADVAAIIMEPVLCNTSVVVPHPGYLERIRAAATRHGVLLIFDEVITGFRVALGGAQSLLGVTPDLAVFAKALGGGFPIAALCGRADLMSLTGGGTVVHGGTYNGNLVSIAAALATLSALEHDQGALYARMDTTGRRLMRGLRAVGAGYGLHVQGLPQVFNTTFGADQEIVDYVSYQATDLARQRRFLRVLQDLGVRPTSRGTWFLSTVHTEQQVDQTIDVVADALRILDADLEPGPPRGSDTPA